MSPSRPASRPRSHPSAPCRRRAVSLRLDGSVASIRSRAFTLIELILVVVLISVLAAVALPRFTGGDRRHAENELAAVEAFLAAVAERDELSSEPLAIAFEGGGAPGRARGRDGDPPARGVLWLQVRRRADPSRPDQHPQWTPDPLVAPVTLSFLTLREAAADNLRLDPRAWRVTLTQTEPRPALSLLLVMDAAPGGAAAAWQVDLPPHSTAPTRTAVAGGALRLMPAPSRAIDLDAVGRGNQPW